MARVWTAAALFSAALSVVACGSGSTPPKSVPAPSPSATLVPFSTSTTEPVATSGTLTAQLAAPGYTGTLTLANVSSQVTSGLTLEVTLQSANLSGFPVLQSLLRSDSSHRRALAGSTIASLLFFELEFSATISSSAGSLTFAVPSGALVAGDAYYVAFFDPNALGDGWQDDWAGPASLAGNTLTLQLPAATFRGSTTYGFAIYGISATASPPTPVPSPVSSSSPSSAPSSAPSPAPSIAPSAAPSMSPSSAPSTAPSASPSASPLPSTAPSPSPSAAPLPSPSPVVNALVVNPTAVDIPSPGAADAQTIAISEAGYIGTFEQTNSCDTGSLIATFSAASAPGPSWNLVVTGVSAGTCLVTITDSHGQSVPVSISVTSSGFTIQSRMKAVQ